ncbi:MAG: tetratricopeptide repeat protein [Isosphaeraceae bacterium]
MSSERGAVSRRRIPRVVVLAVFPTAILLLAGISIAIGLAGRESERKRLRAESFFRNDLEDVEMRLARIGQKSLEDPIQIESHRNELLESVKTCRHGLATTEQLAAQAPSDPRYRRERARVLEIMGDLLARVDEADEAEAAYRKAIAVRGPVIMKDPTSGEDRWRGAVCFDHLGVLLHHAGRWEEAEHFLFRGSKLCEIAPPSAPPDPRVREELVSILCHLSRVQLDRGRRAEALQSYARAVEVQKALLERSPGTIALRERLIGLMIDQANELAVDGPPAPAESILSEARILARRLRDSEPSVTRFHRLEAAVLNRLGDLLGSDPARSADARALLDEAITIEERLVTTSPSLPDDRLRLASMRDNLAGHLRARNEFAEAESLYRKALTDYCQLAEEQPRIIAYRFGYGRVLHNLADLLRVLRRSTEALQFQREAVRLLGSLYRSNVKDPDFRRAFSYACWTLATLLVDVKDHRAAEQAVADYLRIEPNGFEESYEAATILCRCAQIVRDDAAIQVPRREALSGAYVDRAVAALRIAVRNGFRDAKTLRVDTTFSILQTRVELRQLIHEIEAMTGTLDSPS